MISRPATATAFIQWGQHLLFWVLFLAAALGHSLLSAWNPSLVSSVTALGAWYLIGMWIAARFESTPGTRRISWQGAAWLFALIAVWVLVCLQSRPFAWLWFSLSLLSMLLLPTLVGVVVVLGLTGFVIAGSWPSVTDGPMPGAALAGPLLGAFIVFGVAAGYRAIVRESTERARLIVQLTEAQDDLVALQDTLAKTQREAGALGERARLARDIHDTLAQGFSSILLVSRAGESPQSDRGALLSIIAQTAADNLQEARRVVRDLAPADLDAAPLSEAIARQVERLSTQTGIRADLEVDGDQVTLPTGVEVALLRVVQGALANVRSHSAASRVKVTLTYEPDEVRLDVVDDGRGFTPSTAAPRPDGSGFGLRSIRQRVLELGGQLAIESAPGEGTALLATVPIGPSRGAS